MHWAFLHPFRLPFCFHCVQLYHPLFSTHPLCPISIRSSEFHLCTGNHTTLGIVGVALLDTSQL